MCALKCSQSRGVGGAPLLNLAPLDGLQAAHFLQMRGRRGGLPLGLALARALAPVVGLAHRALHLPRVAHQRAAARLLQRIS